MTDDKKIIEFPGARQEEETEPALNGQQLAAGIAMLDEMNRAILKDDPFADFLYRLNMAVLRSGQPVPRSVCVQAGVTKQGLKHLVREGYLKEHRTKIGVRGTEIVGYTLSDNVVFASEQEETTDAVSQE